MSWTSPDVANAAAAAAATVSVTLSEARVAERHSRGAAYICHTPAARNCSIQPHRRQATCETGGTSHSHCAFSPTATITSTNIHLFCDVFLMEHIN